MEVSHSKIKTFRRCKYAYHNKYVRGLKKKVKSHALNVGTIVHECLESWAVGKPYEPVLVKAQKEIGPLFEEQIEELGDPIELARAMVDGYASYYKPNKVVAVEQEIKIPLLEGIDFIGYVDAIIELDNGEWIKEIKTCAKFPDENVRMSDTQTVMYRWALPQMGFNTPRGVVWDYLRKKIPVVPELLKKGGLSMNKSIDTTYEIYYQAIKDHGLNPSDYKDMLENLKNKPNNFHKRIMLPFSKSMEEGVVRDFKETAIEIKQIGHISKARNLTRDCSWCDYYDLCQAELKNLDVDYVIKKHYTTKEQRDAKEARSKTKSKTKNIR